MDYEKIYLSLIVKRKFIKILNNDDIKEIHHIIPRSLGGNNESYNLVALTPREHFISHLILERIYPDSYEMKLALRMMTLSNKSYNNRNFKLNSKLYDKIRKSISENNSKKFSGKGNPMYGKKYEWIYNDKTNILKRIPYGTYDKRYANLGFKQGYHISEQGMNNILSNNEKMKNERELGINQNKKGCKGSKKIVNINTNEVKILEPGKELNDEMISEGWKYGIYVTEKHKSTYYNKSRKFLFNGELMTYKEISEKTGKNKCSIKNLICRGHTIEHASKKDLNKVFFTYNGITKDLTDWAKETGIKISTLYKRIKINGWSFEKAITTPVKNSTVKYEYDGEIGTISYFAKKYGVKEGTLRKYITINKMNINDAISKLLLLNNKK